MNRITTGLLCLIAFSQPATALTGGISGTTGATNCTSCHATPDPANPFPSTGSLVFPASVTGNEFVAGRSYEIGFLNTGELTAAGAGFNLGDSLAVSQFSAADGDTAVQSAGAEISHANGANFDWSFNWETNEVTGSGQFQWCTMRTDGTGDTGDGTESCATQTFSVVANLPPVAEAGVAQTVSEGATVDLDGTASTDEFPDLTFAWTQTAGPTISLTDADTATPSFSAPGVDLAGDSITLELTVTEVDHDDLSSTDTVVITIDNTNQAPIADAGPDQSVAESVTVTLDGSASSDPDVGDSLTYAWLQTAGTTVGLSSATSPSPTFTSPTTGGELLTFQLTVTDTQSATSTNSVNINVAAANLPPVADAGDDVSVDEGTVVQLSGGGSTDETPGSLTYFWEQISGPPSFTTRSRQNIQFTAAQVGFDGITEMTAQLTVTDVFGLSSIDTVVITINNVNAAPIANAGSDQTVAENVAVTLLGSASTDPDLALDDVLTFAWTQTGGTAVSLTGASTATPTFTSPSVGAGGGSSTFLLTVTDRGSLQSTDSVVVNFTDGNTGPVANAGPDQTVDEGAAVTLSAAASTDDELGTVTYAWVQTSGPSVTINGAATVTASFTAPAVGFDTVNTIIATLTVTDAEGLTSTDTVVVSLNNVNVAPTANAGGDQTVTEGVLVSLTSTASTDPDLAVDDELTFAWAQTSGPAVSLTGAGTETPTFQSPNVAAGGESATFTLTVTDRGLLASTDTVVVSITDSNTAPVANAGSDQTLDEGAAVALSAAASTDDVLATLAYSWVQTSGPSVGLTGADTVTPSFTAPTVGFDGVNAIVMTLTVTDEEGLTSTDTVVVNVNNVNVAPTANAGSDQTVSEEVLVSLTGSASADSDLVVDDVLSFAWTQTAGPAVSLTGANSDTPTFQSPNAAAGGESATFLLTVTDRGLLESTDSVVINFTDGNTSPIANAGSAQSVDEGVVVALSAAASTDDVLETLEYAWVQSSGPSVAIGGADTLAPSFTAPDVGFDSANAITVTLTVTDEEGLTSTDAVTVTINNVNQAPVANAGIDQAVSEESLVSLNGSASTDADLAVDDVLTFAWTQTSGPVVNLTGAASETPSFQAPSVTGSGESSTFTLTVTDRGLLESTDTVVISFTDLSNQTPVVNAGNSVEVVEAMVVSLDGSASTDPDGAISLFQWTQTAGPLVELQQSDEAVTTFTAPEVPATGATLTFQLQVTDDEDATANALVNIFVRDTAGVLGPVAAILPSSRSALVSSEVGAFATVINPSDIPVTACTIAPSTSVPATFSFFATDPATNAITGAVNTPIDIQAQSAQSFVLFFTANAEFAPTDVEFTYVCSNSAETQTITGVNTLLFSAANAATADMVALVASASGDGVARIPGPTGIAAFSVATANVGVAADITATAEASLPGLNISLSICETNPANGACLAPPSTATDSTVAASGTSTYSVFVTATGEVAFDPASTRIRVLFEENGVVRGSTSIAVTTVE